MRFFIEGKEKKWAFKDKKVTWFNFHEGKSEHIFKKNNK